MLYEEPEQTYHVMTLDAGTQAWWWSHARLFVLAWHPKPEQ
jgi:hypothetical protein